VLQIGSRRRACVTERVVISGEAGVPIVVTHNECSQSAKQTNAEGGVFFSPDKEGVSGSMKGDGSGIV